MRPILLILALILVSCGQKDPDCETQAQCETRCKQDPQSCEANDCVLLPQSCAPSAPKGD